MNKHLPLLYLISAIATGQSTIAQWARWSQRNPSYSPAPRRYHAMCYDSSRNRVVMYGGQSIPPGDRTTYEWDGANWSASLSWPSPPPWMTWNSMVYDEARQRCVLVASEPTPSGTAAVFQTWEWNGSSWLQRQPNNSPPPRHSHVVAYDAPRQQVILYGGVLMPAGSQRLYDTWAWDGINWSQVQTPNAPSHSVGGQMALDRSRGRVVLYRRNTGHTNEFDGIDWHTIQTPSGPTATEDAGFFFDSASSLIVATCGIDGRGNPNAATWGYRGSDWFSIPAPPLTHPSPRFQAAVAFDAGRGRAILFGGTNGNTLLQDTWDLEVVATAASANSYGVGCAGSNGVPMATPVNLPTVGSTFRIAGANMPTASPTLAIGFFGFSRTTWGFNPLPYHLNTQGLPGCFMLAAPPPPGIIVSTFANAGHCSWDQPVPTDHTFIGLELYFQALIPDAQAGNPLGATVTNGVVGRIGL